MTVEQATHIMDIFHARTTLNDLESKLYSKALYVLYNECESGDAALVQTLNDRLKTLSDILHIGRGPYLIPDAKLLAERFQKKEALLQQIKSACTTHATADDILQRVKTLLEEHVA